MVCQKMKVNLQPSTEPNMASPQGVFGLSGLLASTTPFPSVSTYHESPLRMESPPTHEREIDILPDPKAKAALTTGRIYRFPEFDFLRKCKDFTTRNVPFNPQSVVGQIDSTLIHPMMFDQLLSIAEPSAVGVGSETVHDREVRESSEIELEPNEIYPQFVEMILPVVQEMVAELDHPTRVELQPYKVVLYREGDHFKSHIDNEHSPHMIATLVVEFPSDAVEGKLGFDSVEADIDHPPPESLGLTLFFNDVKHSVSKVEKGRRMALTFNVIATLDVLPQVMTLHLSSFQTGIAKLQARNVTRIGFVTTRVYLSSELKGVDLLGQLLFKTVARDVFVEEVAQDGRELYFADLAEIGFQFTSGGILYRDVREDDDQETEGVYLPRFSKYEEIRIATDPSNKYRVIDPKYRMGNIILLDTCGILRIAYKSGDDIYLGNEGFSGQISTNLGVFADL
jgi:hypothetical protein